MKDNIRLFFVALLSAQFAVAQPTPPSSQSVTATTSTGALVSPSNFWTGNQAAITSVVGNATWTTPLSGANGGTGVSNTGKTITLGGNLTTTGAFNLGLSLAGNTAVSLPTTGTLSTLAGSETLTNKSIALGDNTLTGTSAQLGTAISDETGSGSLVFATSPTFTTPILGAATATSVTAPASTNLTLSSGLVGTNRVNIPDTLTASSSLSGALTVGNGTAATNVAIGGGNINAGGTGVFAGTTGTPTAASVQLGGSATLGGIVRGTGSTYDVTLQSSNGTSILAIPTGTGNLTFLPTGGALLVNANSASTGVGTGALQVAGGIYAGAASVFGGDLNLPTAGSVLNLTASFGGSSALSGTGLYVFGNGAPFVNGLVQGAGAASFQMIKLDTQTTNSNFYFDLYQNGTRAGYLASRGAASAGLEFSVTGAGLNLPNATSASTSTTGALTVGNGTAATNVSIGGGNINAGGTITSGKPLITSPSALSYAAPTSVDTTLASFYTVTTVNATGSVTFNATTGGTSGQRMTILIVNDATSGKTITFGTNFRAASTLVGTVSKAATVSFISDGTSFVEVARATGL